MKKQFMQKPLFILFIFTFLIMLSVILFSNLKKDRELNGYLKDITKYSNMHIISFAGELGNYDYVSDKETIYKSVSKNNDIYNSIIKMLQSTENMKKILNSKQKKFNYKKTLFVNLETSEGVKQIIFRVNTQNFNLYFPQIDSFYESTSEIKGYLKEIFKGE